MVEVAKAQQRVFDELGSRYVCARFDSKEGETDLHSFGRQKNIDGKDVQQAIKGRDDDTLMGARNVMVICKEH